MTTLRQPCWILCTPRTGSSYLCELLNNIGLPKFNHKNMNNNIGPLQYDQTFNEWCRLYENFNEFLLEPPLFCKMIHHQLFEVVMNIPKQNRYSPGFYSNKYNIYDLERFSNNYNAEFFKRILYPDLKLILLKRNIIDNAVSIYCSRMTKKYHIYNKESLEDYHNTPINICAIKLLEAYNDAKMNENIWNSFLENQTFLSISYEDLIFKTEFTFNKILNYLNLNLDSKEIIKKTNDKQRIFKMTRNDHVNIKKKLQQILNIKLI